MNTFEYPSVKRDLCEINDYQSIKEKKCVRKLLYLH